MKLVILTASAILVVAILVLIAGPAAARGVSLEMAQPLQSEIFERVPNSDFGFHPYDMDTARTSAFWNAFPEPLQVEFFEKNPTEAVRQPQQDEPVRKNPTEAVRQPQQDEPMWRAPSVDMGFHQLGKNPTEAVRQPQQDEPIRKNPTEAVRQPQQDEPIRKNPTDAVKQPPQCDTMCERNPSQAVREPLDIECCGPTMSFRLKEDAHAEIAIYNVNGRLVRSLNEMLPSGESSLTWDGMDDRGSRAASGVYFARVQADQDTGKGKLVLIR